MIYDVVIANGGTASGWINIGTDKDCNGLVAIATPAALTSTSMTLSVSLDGSTALSHYDYTGSTYSIPVAADRFISLDPARFCGFPFVKITVGSAEAAERTIKLIVREVS